jgi:hypothetical protein
MPIPLITAAEVISDREMKELVTNPFMVSPLFVGSDKLGYCEASKYKPGNQLGDGHASKLSLADAICVSGAAVNHKMSTNPAIRVMMDFLGLNLGRRLRDPKVAHEIAKGRRSGSPWHGYLSRFIASLPKFKKAVEAGAENEPEYRFIADGGFADFLGVQELLKRRCRLIVVSDAGVNSNEHELEALANMLETSQQELGVRFLDLDHDRPINFRRLDRMRSSLSDSDDAENSVAPQHFVCMRIDYPDIEEGFQDAYLIYAQMIISDDDPLEIRQIRQKFPNFPDVPTTNQFFTKDQVSAYRRLGYHIGSLICTELSRWTSDDIQRSFTSQMGAVANERQSSFLGPGLSRCDLSAEKCSSELKGHFRRRNSQPLFEDVLSRLLQGYRMACFREHTLDANDVFSESIWQSRHNQFPLFEEGVSKLSRFTKEQTKNLNAYGGMKNREDWLESLFEISIDRWMTIWERNPDVRNAYRNAVFQDVNLLENTSESDVVLLHNDVSELVTLHFGDLGIDYDNEKIVLDRLALAMHLAGTVMACQQFHAGWLGKIFQVGGRKKLVAILNQISRDWTHEEASFAISSVCPSLLELQTCVFRKGARSVVVSFALCLAVTLHSDSTHEEVVHIKWKSVATFIESLRKGLKRRSREKMETALNDLVESLRQMNTGSKSKKKALAK